MKRQSPNQNKRIKLRIADGAKIMPCAHCAKWLPLMQLTIDHVQPKSHGGGFSYRNSALACKSCNQERGCTDFWVFRAQKRSQVLGVIITEAYLVDEKPIRFEYTIKKPFKLPKMPPLTHRIVMPPPPKGYKCGAQLANEPWVKKTAGWPESMTEPKDMSFDEFWLWAMRVKREEDL